MNSNVKDIKEKIGDQEKTIEDRKKSIDESNTNLNDLRIKEVELHGESIGIESTIGNVTYDFINPNRCFDQVHR